MFYINALLCDFFFFYIIQSAYKNEITEYSNTRPTLRSYNNGAYIRVKRIKKRHYTSVNADYLSPTSTTHTSKTYVHTHTIQCTMLYVSTYTLPHKTHKTCILLWSQHMSLVAKLPYPTVYYKSVICTLPLSLRVMASLSPLSTPINSNVMLLNEITYMCHFSSTIFII